VVRTSLGDAHLELNLLALTQGAEAVRVQVRLRKRPAAVRSRKVHISRQPADATRLVHEHISGPVGARDEAWAQRCVSGSSGHAAAGPAGARQTRSWLCPDRCPHAPYPLATLNQFTVPAMTSSAMVLARTAPRQCVRHCLVTNRPKSYSEKCKADNRR